MKRFTVSLDSDMYDRLLEEASRCQPPATLQQMIRHAVEGALGAEDASSTESWAETELVQEAPTEDEPSQAPVPTDLSTFRLANVWFGLPVELVEGIAARTPIETIPTHRHDVAGAIRYRDGLLTVIDASAHLGTAPIDITESHQLVIRQRKGPVALAVEEVGSLVDRSQGSWHALPNGSTDLSAIGVTAVVDCGDRLINVLSDLNL